MKILSHSLKTRIYPKWFPNASAVTWSLVLQTRKLANKTEQFWKCDDLSGEINQLTDMESMPLRVEISQETLNGRTWLAVETGHRYEQENSLS
jgi:hypothetical protein